MILLVFLAGRIEAEVVTDAMIETGSSVSPELNSMFVDRQGDDLLRPHGGRIGMIMGGSGLFGAWMTRVFLADLESPTSDIGGPAIIATIGVSVIVISLAMVRGRFGSTNRRGRRLGMIFLGLGVAFGFASRSAIDEISRRSDASMGIVNATSSPVVALEVCLTEISFDPERSPDRDPIVRGTGRVTEAKNRWFVGRMVRLRFDHLDRWPMVGDRFNVRGRWQFDPRPRNPGEPALIPSSHLLPGMIVVPHVDLVGQWSARSFGLPSIRNDIRRRWWVAVEALVDKANQSAGATAGGLIDALLTGRRARLPDGIRNAAVRSGLAHLLAISGLHIGIIAGLVMLPLGSHRITGRLAGIGAVLAFSLVVDPGPSVDRSVWMAGIGGLILLGGRRVRGRSLLLLVLAGIVWVDPAMMSRVGFELTAIATIGLVWSSKTARRRWFGPPDRIGIRRSSLLEDRFATAATAGIVAWSSTLPLVLSRFGSMSLISVPATLVAAPILILVLGTAIVAAGIESVSPGAAVGKAGSLVMLPASIAVWMAGNLGDLILACGRLMDPISVGTSRFGSVLGVPLALLVAVSLGLESNRARWSGLAVAVIMLILITQPAVGPGRPRMIHMLSVGDGTAILVQDGDRNILFDAGSSSIGDVGRRVLIPTLRRLGVPDLDAVIVSHANSDHYGGVVDLVELMPVGRVVVGKMMNRQARSDPSSAVGRWMTRIRAAGVEVQSVERGDEFRTETMCWRVLHPIAGEPTRSLNDGSLVLSLEALGSSPQTNPVRILLCGDIQTEGIGRLLSREPDLRADVMELPHHGSWNPTAVALLGRVDPQVVLQSTGPIRWARDRFADACRGRLRLVTCRDGMVSISLGDP